MDDDKIVQKGKALIQIGWWVLLLYMLVVFAWIYNDSRTNTEYYALVGERPENVTGMVQMGDSYVMPDNSVIPAWQFRASTTGDCKPLTRIASLWNTHGMIMLWASIILTIIKIVLDNLPRIRKWEATLQEENKPKEPSV